MDLKDKLYVWVENKLGDKIDKKIDDCFNNNEEINVESYAKQLVQESCFGNEIQKLFSEKDWESDFSATVSDEELVDGINLSALSIDGDIASDQEKSYRDLLQALEYDSVDDILNLKTWKNTRRAILQLLTVKDGNSKPAVFALKVLQRLLTSNHSSKTVFEGFTTLSDSISHQIETINKKSNAIESEELFDIRGTKVYRRSSQRRRLDIQIDEAVLDTLIRSMHLLVSAHDNMPGVWVRFNVRILQDVIFSFVGLLSASFHVENDVLSAFDVLTILQPRGNWCKHWTHSSTGRNLLCQAFRKQRRLFTGIVETVIHYIIAKQDKQIRHKSPQPSSEEKPIISSLGVSQKSLEDARFSHCFAILTFIVRFKAGRALLPLQLNIRRRPWTAQDVVSVMVDYIELVQDRLRKTVTPSYLHFLMEMGRMLLETEEEILTARGRQGHRRSR